MDAFSPSESLTLLLHALQQLKYSPDENTHLELSLQYKTDGHFLFNLGKHRIAASIFSEAIKTMEQGGETSCEEEEEVTAKIDALLPTLYNNRGVCQSNVDNFRSALTDFENALPDSEGNAQLSRHKEKSAKAKQTKESFILMERIGNSGVKMLNANFLQVEGGSDAVVKINSDELVWPVLFWYPEFSTSNVVKEFRETDEFLPHVDGQSGGWVKVDQGTALRDVMRQNGYYLPTNGVPAFSVISKTSKFSKVFQFVIEAKYGSEPFNINLRLI
ncbi:uncharacterized protein LOC110856381 [Folsomia candida]|uniref:uncharacterized protein LOC110856381 n=1 Tax=Folsomia candida TaxID=158441 RepID=UPI001604DE5C|nr:uncharacterized protein LOC110856381 [Folsomia candida]